MSLSPSVAQENIWLQKENGLDVILTQTEITSDVRTIVQSSFPDYARYLNVKHKQTERNLYAAYGLRPNKTIIAKWIETKSNILSLNDKFDYGELSLRFPLQKTEPKNTSHNKENKKKKRYYLLGYQAANGEIGIVYNQGNPHQNGARLGLALGSKTEWGPFYIFGQLLMEGIYYDGDDKFGKISVGLFIAYQNAYIGYHNNVSKNFSDDQEELGLYLWELSLPLFKTPHKIRFLYGYEKQTSFLTNKKHIGMGLHFKF